MYLFNKHSNKVKVFCKTCQQELEFHVPEEVFKQERKVYPFAFRHIHGVPPHSVTLFFDKNRTIRGVEYGDSVQLSEELLDYLFEHNKLKKDSSTEEILELMLKVIFTVLETTLPNVEQIKYRIGTELGKRIARFLNANTTQETMEKLKVFWKDHNLGEIKDVKISDDKIEIKVYGCIECEDLIGMEHPVCKMDEGIFTSLLNESLNSEYIVHEDVCMAMGNDYCGFTIKKVS